MIRELFDKARHSGSGDWLASEYGVTEFPGRNAGSRVWAGFSGEGLLAAFFECSDDQELKVDISQTISVSTASIYNEMGERLHAIQVQCIDSRLNDVFFTFIDDVLSAIDAGQSVTGALGSTAAEWRSLLAMAKQKISDQQLRGLFGELSFLRGLAEEIGPGALECWTGPDRGRHDFVGPEASVEMKTSSLQNRQAVTIHGLRQLDPAEGATLTLGVAEVEPHPQGILLDEIVDSLIGIGLDREVLRARLATAGFVQGMPDAANRRFQLVGMKFWEITDESPVLRRSALPEGIVNAVSDVRYSLDLGALGKDFATEFDYARLGGTGPE